MTMNTETWDDTAARYCATHTAATLRKMASEWNLYVRNGGRRLSPRYAIAARIVAEAGL